MFLNSTSEILSFFFNPNILLFKVFVMSFPVALFLKDKGSPAIDNRLYGFDILSPASFLRPLKKSVLPSLKIEPSFKFFSSSTWTLSLLVKSFKILTSFSPLDQISPPISSLALASACCSSSFVEILLFLTSPLIYFLVFAQGSLIVFLLIAPIPARGIITPAA